MEKFEEYFLKADLDRDGRISGAEAVAFLQGSNLHRQVLAQIWMHADQNRTGFLTRPEFYNVLRLVTVAQSKRELTPDIVKAALYGPASAKIPPPVINVSSTPGPQPSPIAASSLTQVVSTSQPSSQNLGFRGLAPPSSSINEQPVTVLPTSGMNQQNQPVASSTGMNQQFGMVPSSLGVNQQHLQAQPANTMNHQFRQALPMGSMNQHFGQLQPSSAGMNQQYGQVPPNKNLSPQYFPSQGNQMKPPLSVLTGPAPHPTQVASGLNVSGGMVNVGLPNQMMLGLLGKALQLPLDLQHKSWIEELIHPCHQFLKIP